MAAIVAVAEPMRARHLIAPAAAEAVVAAPFRAALVALAPAATPAFVIAPCRSPSLGGLKCREQNEPGGGARSWRRAACGGRAGVAARRRRGEAPEPPPAHLTPASVARAARGERGEQARHRLAARRPLAHRREHAEHEPPLQLGGKADRVEREPSGVPVDPLAPELLDHPFDRRLGLGQRRGAAGERRGIEPVGFGEAAADADPIEALVRVARIGDRIDARVADDGGKLLRAASRAGAGRAAALTARIPERPDRPEPRASRMTRVSAWSSR